MGRKIRFWFWAIFVVVAMAALVNAYGSTLVTLVLDTWGQDFAYYDNGESILTKTHRLPPVSASPQVSPETPWPEKVLRPACAYTLNLMGLSGPEGDLWTAAMEDGAQDGDGTTGTVLVVRATYNGAVVGRYRVLSGAEESGLVIVELDAGPNGLHLMDVMRPGVRSGWFVVNTYRVAN